MAKYMTLWEIDISRIPEDQKAKKAKLQGFGKAVLKQLKEGTIKDWGVFAGEMGGYTIFEGNAVDLHAYNAMWAPVGQFKVRQVLTIDEVNKATDALPE